MEFTVYYKDDNGFNNCDIEAKRMSDALISFEDDYVYEEVYGIMLKR